MTRTPIKEDKINFTQYWQNRQIRIAALSGPKGIFSEEPLTSTRRAQYSFTASDTNIT